ncbi:hypothetical protein ACRRTK_001459 [Alexandromys fortis]
MDFTLLLSFLVLLSTVAKATTADAASLCYSFTVGKSGSGPWRHKVQGQLNEETFLSYSSSSNCQAIGAWGNRLNATKICDKQVDTLKDGVDLLKEQAVHMKREKKTFRASTTTTPHVDQPLSLAIKPNISVPLIILRYSLLLWSLRRIIDTQLQSHLLGAGPQEGNMAKAAATRRNLSLVLCLFVVLSCLGSKLLTEVVSLCYTFTDGQTGPGPLRQEVKGQANKETFVSCDSNSCRAVGVLGRKLKATETWQPQIDTLHQGSELFKALVIRMMQENTMEGSSKAMTIKPHISVLLILLTCSLLLLLSRGSLAMAGTEGSDGNRGTCRPAEVPPREPPLHAKLRPAAAAVRTPVLIHSATAGCPGELLRPEPS